MTDAKETTGLSEFEKAASASDLSKLQAADVDIAAMASKDYTGPGIVTNFLATNSDERKLLFKSAGDPDFRPTEIEGQVWKLTYWVAARAQVQDPESGTLNVVPRCTFYNDKNETVAFTSWSVARYLTWIVLLFGVGPYDPPLQLLVSTEKVDRLKSTYKVELVD